MRPAHIIISCEHGGNLIPHYHSSLFNGAEEVLNTHKGWDVGALTIAKKLSRKLESKLFFTKISRLLIDCNRSVDNKEVFSVYTQNLSVEIKNNLLNDYYFSYRNKIEQCIAAKCNEKPVLHLSVHTFTPTWHGEERMVDIGLLFDDLRTTETWFCDSWCLAIQKQLPEKLVMLNVPYHGADDGFTTYLRKKFPENLYLGIELEVNQKWADSNQLSKIIEAFHITLDSSLGAFFNMNVPSDETLD
jgi:predicted N-formylglutamate amidohydrolase